MKELTFYTYPSCTSCRKTKSWLNAHQVHYTERHLFKDTPSKEELLHLLSMTTEGVDELLATRSQTFKKLNLNINDMKLHELVELLSKEPRLLRRPLVTDGKRLVVGYNQSSLRSLSKRKQVISAVS